MWQFVDLFDTFTFFLYTIILNIFYLLLFVVFLFQKSSTECLYIRKVSYVVLLIFCAVNQLSLGDVIILRSAEVIPVILLRTVNAFAKVRNKST